MSNAVRFCLFTRQKKPYAPFRKGQREWQHHATDLATARRYLQEHAPNDYLGLVLDGQNGLFCIDIDDVVPPSDTARVCSACDALFGTGNYYMERSLSGNGIHIVARTTDAPPIRAEQGVIFGYRAEIYYRRQGILLTENTLTDVRVEQIASLQAVSLDNLRAIFEPSLRHPSSDPAPTARQATAAVSYPPKHSLPPSPRKRHVFMDVVHLFPSFYEPLVAHFYHHNAGGGKEHWIRPGKPKKDGHSATFFRDTGVVYNFSTNWAGMPVNQGQRLFPALVNATGINAQELAHKFYQYLKTTSQSKQIPIPKRNRNNYFRINRKRYHGWIIMRHLWQHNNQPRTVQAIQALISHTTRYQFNRSTIQRLLYELMDMQLIRRTKQGKHFVYQLTTKAFNIMNMTSFLEIGWQMIIIQTLLDKSRKNILATIINQIKEQSLARSSKPYPPHVYLCHLLHTCRRIPLFIGFRWTAGLAWWYRRVLDPPNYTIVPAGPPPPWLQSINSFT